MLRSFQIVEDKIEETHFFLEKLEGTTYKFRFFESRYYLSAFLSASRSITFALQASLSDMSEFKAWYDKHQETMRRSRIAKYFLEARNSSQKLGYYPLVGGYTYVDNNGANRVAYCFDPEPSGFSEFVPEEDVLTACKSYFKMLLEVIYDCYQTFGLIVDPEQYFSFENMSQTGKTIEDFEANWGFLEAGQIL